MRSQTTLLLPNHMTRILRRVSKLLAILTYISTLIWGGALDCVCDIQHVHMFIFATPLPDSVLISSIVRSYKCGVMKSKLRILFDYIGLSNQLLESFPVLKIIRSLLAGYTVFEGLYKTISHSSLLKKN